MYWEVVSDFAVSALRLKHTQLIYHKDKRLSEKSNLSRSKHINTRFLVHACVYYILL